MSDYHSVDRCLSCDGTTLVPYLWLGRQPLANDCHRGLTDLKTYPLEIAVCPSCFHSQLTVAVRAERMFDEYLYVSGTSATLRQYFKGFVSNVMSRWREVRPPTLLEIACNDGTLLELFRDVGCVVLGVDPAVNLKSLAEAKGLRVVTAYWGLAVAAALEQRFDIVVAVNVLPHVPNPREFLEACRSVLAPGGRIIIQTSQCDMFVNGEFDAIYHEHSSYFTARSFTTLARRCGLSVKAASKVPIHSSSFLFELGPVHDEAGQRDIDAMVAAEDAAGLHDVSTYLRFGERAAETRTTFLRLVDECRGRSLKLVGYGAAAKGNTFLNYAERSLDYIVDDNRMKWGYLTPGRNIPIRAPQELYAEPSNVAVVVLAWNFFDEIRSRIQLRRPGRNDMLIRCFPELDIDGLRPNGIGVALK